MSLPEKLFADNQSYLFVSVITEINIRHFIIVSRIAAI